MERREEESAKGAWKEMPSTSEVLDRNTAIQNLFDTVLAGPVASSADSSSTPPS
jgi:hypothetical protein